MSDRQFIDTNILIYAYDGSTAAKHERARALLEQLWETGAGSLSIQVLQEFYVNITRKVPQPLALETARQIVADLSIWPIHSPTAQDVIVASQLQERYGLSFWDAMIIVSASQLECDSLLSEDLSTGQVYDVVRVINPFLD